MTFLKPGNFPPDEKEAGLIQNADNFAQYLQQKDTRINKQTHKQTSEDYSFSDPYNGSFVFTKTHGDLTKVKGISLPCEIYLLSPQPVSLAPPERGGGPHDVQGMRQGYYGDLQTISNTAHFTLKISCIRSSLEIPLQSRG